MAQGGYEERSEAVTKLRDHFISELLKIEGVVLNGSEVHRLANNINISIPGIDTEYAVITLDAAGIACSTKSACGGTKGGGSYVVEAMTGDSTRSNSTIRFSLGPETTRADIDVTIKVLKAHIEKTRAFMQR